MKGFVKDPQAILDYTFDWGPWLGSTDTITISTWVVESPIVSEGGGESKTDTTTTLFVSGGVHGNNYDVTNSITTLGGRKTDRSIELRVRNR